MANSSNRYAGANLGVRDADPRGGVVVVLAGEDRLDTSPYVYGGVGIDLGGESLLPSGPTRFRASWAGTGLARR